MWCCVDSDKGDGCSGGDGYVLCARWWCGCFANAVVARQHFRRRIVTSYLGVLVIRSMVGWLLEVEVEVELEVVNLAWMC